MSLIGDPPKSGRRGKVHHPVSPWTLVVRPRLALRPGAAASRAQPVELGRLNGSTFPTLPLNLHARSGF
jgi:hypothetical protein